MNTTACAHVRSRLSAYLDGVLAPEEHERVEGHLSACAACAAELDALAAADAALGAVDGEALSAPALERIVAGTLDRIEHGEGSTSSPVDDRASMPWWRRRVAMPWGRIPAWAPVAATACVLVVSLQLWRLDGDPVPIDLAGDSAPGSATEQLQQTAPAPAPASQEGAPGAKTIDPRTAVTDRPERVPGRLEENARDVRASKLPLGNRVIASAVTRPSSGRRYLSRLLAADALADTPSGIELSGETPKAGRFAEKRAAEPARADDDEVVTEEMLGVLEGESDSPRAAFLRIVERDAAVITRDATQESPVDHTLDALDRLIEAFPGTAEAREAELWAAELGVEVCTKAGDEAACRTADARLRRAHERYPDAAAAVGLPESAQR